MTRMRRFALALSIVLSGLLGAGVVNAGSASAARPHPGYPITIGEHTRQVCDAEWFLRAQRPSHYRNAYYRVVSKPVVRDAGHLCKWTVADAFAVRRLKYRLGFPPRALHPPQAGRFGGELRTLLLGGWARSQEMQHYFSIRKHPPRTCTPADRLIPLARSQLGSGETWGNNWGPNVEKYQAVTGAYRAAWCVSFQQWLFKTAGVGTFANDSASVYYVLNYGRSHGWRSQTRPGHRGDIVVFHTWQGHMGIEESATPGGFYSIEGNASDTVLRRFHPWGARDVTFLTVPGTDRKIRCGT